MNEEQQYNLKQNLEIVINEAFERAALKKFKELNFVFSSSHSDNKSKKRLLDNKLLILKNLDIYSKTFLSIHTRAKIALREIQNNKREGIDWAYLELLKMIFTLNESISKKRSVGIREKEKHEWDLMEVGKELTPESISSETKSKNTIDTITKDKLTPSEPSTRKIKYLKEGETGHEINKVRRKTKKLIDKCLDIKL